MTIPITIEVQAKTSDAVRGLEAMTEELADMRQRADKLAGPLGDAAEGITDAGRAAGKTKLSLADIKAGFDMVGSALGTVKQAFDATVMKAAEWGDSMGDLSQLTGATVQDTSRMATVFELVGMDVRTLESSLRTLTKNGMAPNLETMKRLSAQYQAIQDPVKKNEFLFKNFGRAGLEMAEIMGKSADELEALGRAADASGKVIDEQAAAAAERFNIRLAEMQQKADGVAIAIGTNLLEAWDALTTAQEENNATASRAQLLYSSLAGGVDLTTERVDFLEDHMSDLTTASDAQVRTTEALSAETARWAGIAEKAAADKALQQRLEDLTGAASDLKFGMGELTTATLYHQAAQGLDADAAYALAESMGLIDPQAAAAKEVLDGLRAELESGAITAGQYTGAVSMLNNAISTLPDGKRITIEYIEQYRQEFNADTGVRGGTNNARQGGAIGDGYASGGQFIVPPGYPNDTYPMRVSSGEMVTVIPANNTFNINGAGNPQGVALAVRAELDRLGRQTDTRMRTR